MSNLKLFSRKLISGLLAVFLSAILSSIASSVTASELTVKVTNISQPQGHLFFAIYRGKQAYESGRSEFSQKKAVSSLHEEVIFKDLADGDYVIKVYHDENDNEHFDTNFFGIPKEGYGFSNNGGQFGAPDYEDALIRIKDNLVIEIELR